MITANLNALLYMLLVRAFWLVVQTSTHVCKHTCFLLSYVALSGTACPVSCCGAGRCYMCR